MNNSSTTNAPIDEPLMSVVIVTPDNFSTICKTIYHLRNQSVRDKLEIVIVAPSIAGLHLDEEAMIGFANATVVEAGQIHSIGNANAMGIRRATAPIVALAEDHCFPDPDWAERLIESHQGPWAAVGPGVRNANPSTCVSWADLFIGYGPWLVPAEPQEVDFLPGHNSSYKREILLGYGHELDLMMNAETVLHWDLRSKGHRLFHDTSAQVAHTNFSLWLSWLPLQVYNGRHFAALRARQMSLLRRLIYVGGSPLIPAVRLARIILSVLRHRSPKLLGQLVLSLPAVTVGLVLDSFGQWMGYAIGQGQVLQQIAKYEFHRSKHITQHDQELLFS